MPKTYTPPQAFEMTPRLPIELVALDPPSSQIAARGYHPETKTLALTFTRGIKSVYHYPDFPPEQWEAFMAADSAGKFFGANIKPMPFKKYPADPIPEAAAE